MENKKNLRVEEQFKIEKDIVNCQATLEEMTSADEYDCAKCGRCDFKSMNELELHEVECFNYKREVIVCKPVKKEKKLYSSETATCDKCNKKFLHTCKTSTPKHQLTRHQKTCKGQRHFKQRIKDFTATATDEQLQKMYEFMQSL